MYATDEKSTDVTNKNDGDKESIQYQDLYNIFQLANCLNLKNFISDEAKNNTSVIYMFLEKESYPSTKE